MSEPIKKFPHDAYGYAPKDKPSILDLAEEAGASLSADKLQPPIIAKKFTLAGLEAKLDLNTDFTEAIEALRLKLRQAAADIPGKISPVRLVGFWQPDSTYFAGVEILSAGADLKGLVVKDLPESLFAVFREKRRGTVGGYGGYAYTEWYPSSGYAISEELPGDFEIFDDLVHCDEYDECDILIPIRERADGPETYAPKDKPAIINMAEQIRISSRLETVAEQVSEFCMVVDRSETLVVGIGVPVSFESPGYGATGAEYVFASNDVPYVHGEYTLNDYFIAKKYIWDGTAALLARTLGVPPDAEIICARTDIRYDGNYTAIIGFAVGSPAVLPDFLPENTVTLTIPAGRYAKILINEQNREGRTGYPERMNADEFFTRAFRKQTPYVYNKAGTPMYFFDGTGDVLSKYEPLKIPADENERWDTIQFRPVLLPEMNIACSISPPDGEFVIMKYFGIEAEVHKTGLTRFYRPDYYGFPMDADNESGYVSCFGSRVTSFDGLPGCAEKVTLPGGMYIHVTQLEFNGDSPDIPYEVAFGHMNELYLQYHPEYAPDMSRKVIARFRQGNCASVFVPVKKA